MATTANWAQNVRRLSIYICVLLDHYFDQDRFGWSFSYLDSVTTTVVAAASFLIAPYQIKSSVQATSHWTWTCHAHKKKFIHRSSSSCKAVRIHKRSSPIKFHFDILICNFVVKCNGCVSAHCVSMHTKGSEGASENAPRFMSLALYIIISRVWVDGSASAKTNMWSDRARIIARLDRITTVIYFRLHLASISR